MRNKRYNPPLLFMIGLLVGSLLLTPVSASVTDNLSMSILQIVKDLQSSMLVLETKVEECFQSASNGKSLIAGYLTEKGVTTADDASFTTLKANIEELVNKQFEEGKEYTEEHKTVTVSWKYPLASRGSWINNVNPPIRDFDKPGWKQILYVGDDGLVHSANPYVANTIQIKYGTRVTLQMYGECEDEYDNALNWIELYDTTGGGTAMYRGTRSYKYCMAEKFLSADLSPRASGVSCEYPSRDKIISEAFVRSNVDNASGQWHVYVSFVY